MSYESNAFTGIVAAVYNGEKFLAQFFECLEQQQLESYELILVNDGSTDGSLRLSSSGKIVCKTYSCWSRKTRGCRWRAILALPWQPVST
jgi:hypothetical protein